MNNIRSIKLGSVLVAFLTLVACSKPALYGTLQPAQEVVRYYQVPPAEAFRAAKESLAFRGYSLKRVDEQQMEIETYWQPSTADSHYVDVFGRRDFGTVGSYYRLLIKVAPQGSGSASKVSITNVAKSFIANLKSSQEEEHSVFVKIDDFTRKQDIQVTNIGLQ